MEIKCEVCKRNDWLVFYQGKIRDGKFGNYIDGATVFECKNCQTRRLENKFCVEQSAYESNAYRQKLKQDILSETFHKTHNAMASYFLSILHPFDLNEKIVVDVGSGGGHLLDAIGDGPSKKIAIEPTPNFHQSLNEKGFEVFSYAENALPKYSNKVDFAFSQFVIEHVENPLSYLKSINLLLNNEGFAIVCTPNADDIMLDMLPDDYPSFFYRTVHRFYFNAKSLTEAGRQAGLETISIRYLQRYRMDNALLWLRDRRPSGTKSFSPINEEMSKMWKERLEELGRSDCIYAIYRKRTNVG